MPQRPALQTCFGEQVHDRMTEQVYPRPLQSFKTDMVPTPVFTVPVMAQGAAALEQINEVPIIILTFIIVIILIVIVTFLIIIIIVL